MLSSSWSTLWVLDHTVSHPLTLAKLAEETWNRLLYDTRIQHHDKRILFSPNCYRKISNAIIEQWHFIWWPVVTLRLVMLSSSWSTLWVLDHTVSHPLTLAKLAKENWNRLFYDTRIQFCTLFWHSLITDHTATRFNIHYAGWRKLKPGAWSHSFTSINIS